MRESQKQGPYHHGQLRQALLDAALHLITEHGIDSLTLREVARQAGVSHAAPYHHFVDKSALVEAVVVECFHALTQALREAILASSTPVERLSILGQAYVRFALEHAGAFRLMYRPERSHSSMPEKPEYFANSSLIDEAANATYQILTDAIMACQEAGFIPAGDPGLLALAAWSTAHGLAVLILDGSLADKLQGAQSAEDVDQLTKAVTQTVIYGLLSSPGR